MHIWLGHALLHRHALTPTRPNWLLPVVVFVLALVVALRASAWFIQALASLSDLLDLSSGVLGLLSALGGNIPNYAASLVAFAGGNVLVGVGIIIGSNIYNIAIILGITTFVTPGKRGIHFKRTEAPDVRTVGIVAVLIGVCTLVALAMRAPLHPTVPEQAIFFVANLLALGIFGIFVRYILHRVTVPVLSAPWLVAAATIIDPASRKRQQLRAMGAAGLALALALGSVIVMVQTGQDAAVALHLPAPILSLLILAVATSLPNTVVAYQLARSGRTVTCVEEIFSSTSINLALGSALPLLIWHTAFHDDLLLLLDAPLMVVPPAFWTAGEHSIDRALAKKRLIGYKCLRTFGCCERSHEYVLSRKGSFACMMSPLVSHQRSPYPLS